MFHALVEQTPAYNKLRCRTRHEIDNTVVFVYTVKPTEAYAISGNGPVLHQQLLESTCTEKALEWWHKQKTYADLELLDPNKEIREKPVVYTPSDVEEFSTQINDLLAQGLIHASYSSHTSPTFLLSFRTL
ncbi:uncharacterized protein [Aristolochia californica]|uniref:uncharacterized protein n=1 Tax=Aristolochia californica TaxID=171875 RepID=UPI0035D73319